MTKNQWRLLDILDHYGGQGTIEVEIQWGDYELDRRPGETREQNDVRSMMACRLVVAGLVRNLVQKGYATDDENGYGITDAGRAVLARHREREAKAPPSETAR